jgi:hypothetical protein
MNRPFVVGRGVFVPEWQCAAVLDALAAYVRRERRADPALAPLPPCSVSRLVNG